ncbi:MAG TPA: O-antigen ligase family protein [Solirubrobacteraceae bacterium]
MSPPAPSPVDTDVWPHTQRAMPWALAGFLTMVWLVPFDSITLPVSLPLDAKLDRPILIGMAGLWVLSLMGKNAVSRLRLSPVHWALLAFVIIAMVSLILNDATIVRLNEMNLPMRKLALLFSYVLLFVIVASSVKPAEVRYLTILMVSLASVTAIGALVEYRTGYNAFFTWSEHLVPTVRPGELGAIDSIGRKSIIGPTIHPLAVAMMMSLSLPFALMGFLSSTERRTKILYALATILMIAAAFGTQRKTSVVAPAFGMMILLAYRPSAARRLLPIGVGLLVMVHLVAPGALGGVSDQLKPGNLFGVMSTKDRQSDYPAIKPDFIQHPILGRGYESYDQKKYRILDNQYLTTIIGVGILGVLSYLAIFGSILLLAHRMTRSQDPKRAGPAIAAAAAIASLVVGSSLLDVFALPQLPYLIMFIGGLVVVSAQADTAPSPAVAAAPSMAPVAPLRPRRLAAD